MNRFIEVAGFELYYSTLAKNFSLALKQIFSLLEKGKWCVIGGTAVAIHLGKQTRVVSPDVDLLMTTSQLSLVHDELRQYLRPTSLGFLYVTPDKVEIDFIGAVKRFERDAIQNSVKIRYKDLGEVSVVSVPHLMVMKFETGREKDLNDLQLLYKHFKHTDMIQKAKFLVRKFYPNSLEDFNSQMELIELQSAL